MVFLCYVSFLLILATSHSPLMYSNKKVTGKQAKADVQLQINQTGRKCTAVNENM